MYFVENVCTPSSEAEIAYCETAIQLGVLNHQALLAIDTYEQCLYLEDGNSEAVEGVFQKMKKAVLDILDKIDSIIRGFLDGIKGGSDNRLTADKYFTSETGKINLNKDILEMQKTVDEEFLEMRKVVKMISNTTGFDPEKVGKACDKINEKLHENRHKLKAGATAAVESAIVYKKVKSNTSKIKELDVWRKETYDSIERMSRYGHKNSKEEPKKVTPMMKAFNKVAVTIGNLVDECVYISNDVTKAMSKVKK